MVKTTFAAGQKVTAAWRNAMQSIAFDDLDIDGHYPRLLDDALSLAPGNIRADFRLFADALKVTYSSGLTVNIAAGVVTLPNGLAATVAATSKTLPASQVSFLWVDTAGAVQFGADLPVRSVPIARFEATASGMAVNGLTDLRSRFTVGPQSRAIRVYGGQATTDITIASNTTLGGRIYCRNFTVNAGVTVSVPSGYLEIIASGTVSIAGTVNVSPPVAGGFGFSGGAQAGYYFAESGRGLGGGGGHNTGALPSYNWAAGVFGSGGASGFGSVVSGASGQIALSKGGSGGGAFIVDAALAVNVSGAINCAGTAGTIGTITGGTGTIVLPGGGGGSGGLIRMGSLTSVTATAAAQLNVQGGAGSPGFSIGYTSNSSFGGGGGAGGWLVCQAPTVNLTGATVLLTGGAAGANFGTGAGIAGSVGASFGGVGGVGGSAPTAGGIGQQVVESFTPV
jgi:hypothetical protein